MDFISSIEKFAKQLGYETEIVSGTPDEDFEMLVKGKHFIQGGGGFSKSIRSVREKWKNKNRLKI